MTACRRSRCTPETNHDRSKRSGRRDARWRCGCSRGAIQRSRVRRRTGYEVGGPRRDDEVGCSAHARRTGRSRCGDAGRRREAACADHAAERCERGAGRRHDRVALGGRSRRCHHDVAVAAFRCKAHRCHEERRLYTAACGGPRRTRCRRAGATRGRRQREDADGNGCHGHASRRRRWRCRVGEGIARRESRSERARSEVGTDAVDVRRGRQPR